MKKTIFATLMAASLFYSCAKDQTLERSASGTIGFESFVGKPSKALEVSTWKNGDRIRVTGYATDAPMPVGADLENVTPIKNLSNKVVTYNGTSWSYTPAAYWVDNKYHTFFATAPSPVTAPLANALQAGKATLTVFDEVEKQLDLMVSDPKRETTAYVQGTTPAAVTFTMRHVLSQVLFRAKIAVEDTSVSEVKITGVSIAPKSGGVFAATGEVDLVGKVNASGPNSVIVLQGATTAASYTITPSPAVPVSMGGYADIKHQGNHVAMLLPQQVGAFTVTATVVYTTGGVEQPAVPITFDAGAITWEPNMKYAYSLNINVPAQVLKKEPIEIGAVDIEPWAAPEVPGVFE